MLHLMDYEAVRLDVRPRRQQPLAPARAHGMRRRLGGWLVGVGSRLAEDDHRPLTPAADCT
jgi:hypothetical protein